MFRRMSVCESHTLYMLDMSKPDERVKHNVNYNMKVKSKYLHITNGVQWKKKLQKMKGKRVCWSRVQSALKRQFQTIEHKI